MLEFTFGLPFCVPKKIARRSEYAFAFIAIFASVQKHKEEKKMKKKIETLEARILEMAGAISFKFGM